jgi:phenylacetate-coenzyme A ligase PaaK-like adenylate-forming protein
MSEQDLLNNITSWPVYDMAHEQKRPLLFSAIQSLTLHHSAACLKYRSILQKLWGTRQYNSLEHIPFLPVRLFKHERLLSVPQSEIVKTMTSSGTTGKNVSQIFLDKQTSAMQVKVLSRIVGEFIGPKRLPMLIIDCRTTVSDRVKFSARTAGILGFSIFGREVEYALDDDMTLNVERVEKFLVKHADQPKLIFGFTFIVWLHLVRNLEAQNKTIDLNKGILIHGGGWKQLQSQAVEPLEFKLRLNAVTGINSVHNYYGMVEQTGSIFMECAYGHLHASAWADVIVRDSNSFKPLPPGQPGLIQLFSVIPYSYPGHSLLSEDEGVLLGNDDCPCMRKGTYFKVLGRIQNAEARGCSDTYTQ